MKRPVKLEIASLKALGAFVALGAVAHAGLPYLPLIGPPPLRAQVMKSPAEAVAKIAAITRVQTVTNLAAILPPAVESVASPGPTNLTALTAAVPIPTVPFIAANPDKSLEDTFTASVFALPTPDLLGITPQMLTTYFRPVGTNSSPLTGPYHVSFIPPLPPPPPDKSSHAEYNVK